MARAVGETILDGRYTIDRLLGSGGFGDAYLATSASGKKAVVKESFATSESLAPEDKKILDRAAAEFEVIRTIDSPHVVKYYEAGFDSRTATYVIVMEPAGKDLAKVLESSKGGIPEAAALNAILQTILGLTAAYKKATVAHRDISPDNIFLSASGIVKVGDFGIAKFKDIKKFTATTVKFMGKPAYAAPECYKDGPGKVDWRADAYALGVVLTKLLTDRLPIEVGESVEEALEAVLRTPPKGPNDLEAGVCSDTTHKLVLKLLEKDPKDRFESPEALVEALGGAEAVRRICTKEGCHELVDEGTEVCKTCGSSLKDSSPVSGPLPEPAPPVPLVVARKAFLVVPVGAAKEGRRIAISESEGSKGKTIGRAEVDAGDRFISRKHIMLVRKRDGWKVKDCGSLNGTYLKASALVPETEYSVEDGEALRLGEVMVQFEARP
jgi:serine/threonine protein kinase